MTREDVARVRGERPRRRRRTRREGFRVRGVPSSRGWDHGRARRRARHGAPARTKTTAGTIVGARASTRRGARASAFKTRVETTREETKPRGARGSGPTSEWSTSEWSTSEWSTASPTVSLGSIVATSPTCTRTSSGVTRRTRVRRTTRDAAHDRGGRRARRRARRRLAVASRESFGDVEECFLERGATHPHARTPRGFAAGTFQRGGAAERRARRRGERERERPAVPGTKRSAGNAANDEVYHRGDVTVVVVVPPRMMLLVMTLAFVVDRDFVTSRRPATNPRRRRVCIRRRTRS